MLSQIYASIGSFLPQPKPMKQRSLNYHIFAIFVEKFLCRLFFFQMIETKYIST